MTATSDLPFRNLKVLDLSQGIAGPYCTHILWQQGATVYKVEPPQGDWGRAVGTVVDEHSALSIAYNSGKKSLCVDAGTPEGKELLLELSRQVDIVVQNFRPGVADRLGVGYEAVRAGNPNVIYVSISGYGPSGPYALSPASDSVMQADSGLMHANINANGEPQRIGLLLVDIVTALYAAQATTTSLFQRALENTGRHIELSLFDACSALQAHNFIEHALSDGAPRKEAVSAPNGIFKTADSSMTILALNNNQFERLCKALGRPEWLDDVRFATNDSRMQHRDTLHAEVANELKAQTSAVWETRFKENDVLYAPVRDYDAVLAHPQADVNKTFQALRQFDSHSLPLAGLPFVNQRRPLGPAPNIGQHSVQILQETGIAPAAIERLLEQGIVRQHPQEN